MNEGDLSFGEVISTCTSLQMEESGSQWSNFYLDASPEIPQINKTDKGIFEPNILYRGSENWLARFSKDNDVGHQRESIRQEVRALFAGWLKMQNVCLLLGAGSSLYVTKFIGAGLFDYIRSILAGRKSEKTLNELLQQASDPDNVRYNFERFLSQLTAWEALCESKIWPMDRMQPNIPLKGVRKRDGKVYALQELLLDIERAIILICNVDLPPSRLSDVGQGTLKWNVTPHEALLAKLTTRNPQQGRAKIFTTNYDTLIEQAMDRLGIIYSDGFTGTVMRRFNPISYDLDLYYPGEITQGRVRRFDKVLHLYKLHGSINWRRTSSKAGDPYGIMFCNEHLPKASDLQKSSGLSLDAVLNKDEGLAILPRASKFGETLAMPFAHLFRMFSLTLTEPQTVLIISGYSGSDEHINRLIEDALGNPAFVCVIVDPNPSQWARKLCQADACGRVYCLGGQWGTFEFFCQHILPDLEVLDTELAIAKTMRDLWRPKNEKEY